MREREVKLIQKILEDPRMELIDGSREAAASTDTLSSMMAALSTDRCDAAREFSSYLKTLLKTVPTYKRAVTHLELVLGSQRSITLNPYEEFDSLTLTWPETWHDRSDSEPVNPETRA